MHIQGALPLTARDREPGVRASAAGQRSGRSCDASAFQFLDDLADEVSLALERKLHARWDVHRGSVGRCARLHYQCR